MLTQEPTKPELVRFKSKLRQLREKFEEKDIPLKNMLHFVIMAENYNLKSSYVKKIVNEALEDIGNYGKQQDLLQYLAIMKYYGDKGLPSTHCHKVCQLKDYFFEECAYLVLQQGVGLITKVYLNQLDRSLQNKVEKF